MKLSIDNMQLIDNIQYERELNHIITGEIPGIESSSSKRKQ